MTPAMVSGIAQTLPLLSNAKLNSSPQEGKGAAPPNAGAVPTKDSTPVTVDTVTISNRSRQTVTEAKREEAEKEEPNKVKNSEKYDRAIAKVQFVYNPKGDLSIRYMDTASRLVYQIPSELMLRLKEAVLKSGSSVDTKA